MGDTFFGCPRPAVTCQARIEVKIPASRHRAQVGRPIRVWTGNSDADESAAHLAICENEVLGRIIRDRRLSTDGSCTLQGKLTFFDGTQVIDKYDIDVFYIEVESKDSIGREHEVMQKLFEQYSTTMKDMKQSYDSSMAKMTESFGKISEAFGKMSEGFSEGLGKISKQNAQIGKITARLERDRRKLNEALITVVSTAKQPAERESITLDTCIRGLALLKGSGGNGSGSNGSGTTN